MTLELSKPSGTLSSVTLPLASVVKTWKLPMSSTYCTWALASGLPVSCEYTLAVIVPVHTGTRARSSDTGFPALTVGVATVAEPQ